MKRTTEARKEGFKAYTPNQGVSGPGEDGRLVPGDTSPTKRATTPGKGLGLGDVSSGHVGVAADTKNKRPDKASHLIVSKEISFALVESCRMQQLPRLGPMGPDVSFFMQDRVPSQLGPEQTPTFC